MIDISLVDTPVSLDEFSYETPLQPSIFLGFIIKNEYDNKRLKINKKYLPKKFVRIFKQGDETKVLPLYGICLELNKKGVKVAEIIKEQDIKYNTNLLVYQNLLEQFDLTCNDCYGYFEKGIYPIDFDKFRYITNEEISKDEKVLQHLLSLDENKFDFQKFGAIKTLILT